MIFILELFTFFHLKVINHICPFISKFDRDRNTDDSGLGVVAVAQVECYLVNSVLIQSQVSHLVDHYLALLGDDVLTLASQRGEYLEVVILLGHTQFVDNAAWQHRLGQPEQVVLVDCNVDDLLIPEFLGQLLDPLYLEFSLLFLRIPYTVPVDDQQLGQLIVLLLILDQTPPEQPQEGLLGDELPVLLVQDEMFTGPVLEFRVQTVGYDEHTRFLVVVDAVAHINTHEHGLVLMSVRY